MAAGKRIASNPSAQERQHAEPLAEVMQRLGRILVSCGYSSKDIHDAILDAMRRLPRSPVKVTAADRAYIYDGPHILTHWYTDPLFLDSRGEPKALKRTGSSESIAALVARVDPKLEVGGVIRHLRRFGALRMRGSRYVPVRRDMSYRGHRIAQHLHGLRVLLGMLRTVEHNDSIKGQEPTWFEFVAENGRVPVRARPVVDRRVRKLGMQFLQAMDLALKQQEVRGRKHEPKVRVGVGVYLYEEPTELPGQARRAGKRRS